MEPFPETSPEIVELAQLYRDIAGLEPSAEKKRAQAHKALCIATLWSAQFVIGVSGPRDALKRALTEIGNRVPTFVELEQVFNGTKSVSQFVKALQQQAGSSYYLSVNQWHEDWLGLRHFIETTPEAVNYNGEALDVRGEYVGGWGASLVGATSYKTIPIAGSNIPKVAIAYPGTKNFLARTPEVAPADPSGAQKFDPRTAMLLYEIRRPNGSSNQWDILGGFVHESFLQLYEDRINQMFPNATLFSSSTSCQAATSPGQVFDPITGAASAPEIGMPRFFRCKGRLPGTSAGSFVETNLSNATSMNTASDQSQGDSLQQLSNEGFVSYVAANGVSLPAWNLPRLKLSVDTRISRFSPGGSSSAPLLIDQNGLSITKPWYTGESRWVSNTIERHLFTCALREHGLLASNGYDAAPGNGYLHIFANDSGRPGRPVFMFAHSTILNMFHCGAANESALTNAKVFLASPTLPGSATRALEDSAFPYGFNYSADNYAFGTQNSTLNDVMSFAVAFNEVSMERKALLRLRTDIQEEPYRLLNHVLMNQLSYQEFFRAGYTLGHSELKLLYMTQAEIVPSRPPGFSVSQAFDENEAPSLFRFADFPQLSSNHFMGLNGTFTSFDLSSYYASPGLVSRRPAAGILAMPAFLSPVNSKMRTISSRYFTRLLCGDPSIFKPNPEEDATHVKFMLTATRNPEAARHLEGKSSCRACHVNLDPLGSALSENYLKYV